MSTVFVDVSSDEPVSPSSALAPVASWQFDLYVEAEADGEATPEQLAVLDADRPAWRAALLRLVSDAEEFAPIVARCSRRRRATR